MGHLGRVSWRRSRVLPSEKRRQEIPGISDVVWETVKDGGIVVRDRELEKSELNLRQSLGVPEKHCDLSLHFTVGLFWLKFVHKENTLEGLGVFVWLNPLEFVRSKRNIQNRRLPRALRMAEGLTDPLIHWGHRHAFFVEPFQL